MKTTKTMTTTIITLGLTGVLAACGGTDGARPAGSSTSSATSTSASSTTAPTTSTSGSSPSTTAPEAGAAAPSPETTETTAPLTAAQQGLLARVDVPAACGMPAGRLTDGRLTKGKSAGVLNVVETEDPELGTLLPAGAADTDSNGSQELVAVYSCYGPGTSLSDTVLFYDETGELITGIDLTEVLPDKKTVFSSTGITGYRDGLFTTTVHGWNDSAAVKAGTEKKERRVVTFRLEHGEVYYKVSDQLPDEDEPSASA